MRTKSCFFLFSFLLCTYTLFSQREETLLGQKSWGFSGIWGGYHHQYTQFGATEAYNRGGFFTFEFGKSLTLGWGHYRLDHEFDWELTDKAFDARFNVAKIGYAFMPYKAIHPTLNVDLGRGWVDLGDERDRVVVVQPAAGVEFNVFRWFRVGLEGGYRFVNDSDLPAISDDDLSGPYGQATLKFGFSWGRFHKRSEPKKYDED